MRGYWLSLLGKRRWIKTFILVATVLTGSAIIGLGIFNKQNIPRADETELPGFDYVEYPTSNIMDGQLDNLDYGTPLPQVNNYSYSFEDTINLRVRLAGLGYFRLPSKDDRQALLAQTNVLSDDSEDNTRLVALVNYLEIQPDGSYAWLDQFSRGDFPCPDGGDKVGMAKPAASVAHAQGVMTCPNREVLAAQEKKDANAYWVNVNTNYDIWDGFYQRARAKFNSYARNEGKDLEPLLFKQYWSAADLDFLYNNIFPGSALKTQRNERQFVLERQYLQGVLKAYKTVSAYRSQGIKDVTIDIAAFFFPPARGGKGIAALGELAAGSRAIRPYALAYVIFKTSSDEAIIPIVDGALAGGSINLTRAFAKAQVLIRKETLLSDGQLVAAQAPKALDRIMKSQYVPAGSLTKERALELLGKTQYYNRNLIATMRGKEPQFGPGGFHRSATSETFINETLYKRWLKTDEPDRIAQIIHIHTHEYLHSLQPYAFKSYYSAKLGYNPLREAFTEFLARKITVENATGTLNFNSYSNEVNFLTGLYHKLADETFRFANGKITKEQADKAVLNKLMSINYGKEDGKAFNQFVRGFLEPTNPYYPLIVSKLDGDIAEFVTGLLEDKKINELRRFVDALKMTSGRPY